MSGKPVLLGRWHHGAGQIVCGTVRIASESFDTDPCQEFKDEMLDWMCETLNQATAVYNATGLGPRELQHRLDVLVAMRKEELQEKADMIERSRELATQLAALSSQRAELVGMVGRLLDVLSSVDGYDYSISDDCDDAVHDARALIAKYTQPSSEESGT